MPLSTPATRTALRSRFSDTSATTASPPRLVTMLYDRLVRDMHEAQSALEAGDSPRAHVVLVHAQDIVLALRHALDPSVWPTAEQLDQLYAYVLERLVEANIRKQAAPIGDALAVIEPLGSAWHEALRSLGTA